MNEVYCAVSKLMIITCKGEHVYLEDVIFIKMLKFLWIRMGNEKFKYACIVHMKWNFQLSIPI